LQKNFPLNNKTLLQLHGVVYELSITEFRKILSNWTTLKKQTL